MRCQIDWQLTTPQITVYTNTNLGERTWGVLNILTSAHRLAEHAASNTAHTTHLEHRLAEHVAPNTEGAHSILVVVAVFLQEVNHLPRDHLHSNKQ